ncbi:fumarate hydratase [Garciella nitratireducens]|uniref:Fumarase, class I alpha subunit n=1 Tax=Garciella nitratireducens DSM 15102 TaxID=1121911 RepID=A0A1T4P4T0_9FIRM|nr:fumarate hydratase [Garciella nitratireducens]RBP46966.1 fumarate hydratase subunit alpha [Garciella nitratireducens]SJZ86459.1 fumarase, class I alpha subunit [Garciella nitratireducens DSM 15102]
MREIDVSKVTKTVKKLCINANYYLNEDIRNRFKESKEQETFPIAKNIIGILEENADIAEKEQMPMCQDTGMTLVFVELGQEVEIVGGVLEDAINEGIRQGYIEGYLRKSVVNDPLERINTKDNTPGVIYYDIVPGDQLKITVAPKGFGSENMSQLKMLKPADGIKGVKDFVLQVVKEAGPNACPPLVVGVGIGGTFDRVALLAKKALLRSTDIRNSKPFYANLEKELLEEINKSGIGPQGFGGKTTALAVNIETYPTHIAGLPVAVNINCHATRHAEAYI